MAKKALARRYAQAIFEIALETKELDKWQSDLSEVARLSDDASVLALLQSPRVLFDDKARVLSGQLKDVNPLALNLVYLLLIKGRLDMVGDITDEYRIMLNSHRGIEVAEVTTAIPLDDEDRQKLSKKLGDIVKKRVEVKSEVDPGLVGGFTARIGGKLLDGSTHSKLVTLKRELVRGGK